MSFPRKNIRKPNESRIRIIAGEWRGRKLPVLDEDGLRPTGDRIRETLFNWLTPYTHNAVVLDLFAGTGALGLEALSRGACSATFVEQNTAVAKQLSANLHTLNKADAPVINMDAMNWLEQQANQTSKTQFDLIFLDPPFSQDLWQKTIEAMIAADCIAEDACIYVESPKNQTVITPANWSLHRKKSTGQICARLFHIT